MQTNQDPTQIGDWRLPFSAIWTGQAFSLAGSTLVSFALIWWLTETAGSATTLSIASVLGWLPVIALGPFAGVLVDRWNRRWVMIVADGVIALSTALLVFLFWAGMAEAWHVYVVLFLRSLGGAFHKPAMTSGTILSVWGGFRRRMVTSIIGTLGIGFGILAIGLVPSTTFPLALVIWLFVGLTFPIALGPIRATYQSSVPAEMQGRFFTLNVAGPLADAFGVRVLWVIAGTALVGLALARVLTPAIFHLGESYAFPGTESPTAFRRWR